MWSQLAAQTVNVAAPAGAAPADAPCAFPTLRLLPRGAVTDPDETFHLAALLVGWAPRATAWSWGLLGFAVVVMYFGGFLDLPQPARNLSPFTHVPQLPAQDLDPVPLAVLASVLQQRGDLAGAETAQREAFGLLRAAHGADSPEAASGAVKLAGLLQRQRRFAEAERLLLDAHAAPRRETAGHHGTGRAVRALIELYEAWGRPGDAARYRALAATSS